MAKANDAYETNSEADIMGSPNLKKPDFKADVVVIGAGLHGCSAALHLALRGLSVLVLEKDYAGRHASGVNAGGVRRLGRSLPEIPLSVASAKIWQNIENLVGDDCGFKSSYQIKVAETQKELKVQQARVSEVRKFGFHHEKMIDQNTLRDLMPNVSPHCLGGIIVEGDGYANPYQTVKAFKLKSQYHGVHYRENTKVKSIRRMRGIWLVECYDCIVEAPKLVNCAGAWGGTVAAMLGEKAPVKVRAPMLMITERMPSFIRGVVGTEGRKLSFKQLPNGTVLIGGGHTGHANAQTNATRLNYSGLASNAHAAKAIFPIMHNARVLRAWAGIEGMMPDGIPVIGLSEVEGAVHGFGFSAHGFQLGPIGGKILSDLTIDGKSDLPIEPFRITRF